MDNKKRVSFDEWWESEVIQLRLHNKFQTKHDASRGFFGALAIQQKEIERLEKALKEAMECIDIGQQYKKRIEEILNGKYEDIDERLRKFIHKLPKKSLVFSRDDVEEVGKRVADMVSANEEILK